MLAHHHHDWGLLSLGGVLLALSLLAGVQMGQRPGIYLAGEIAAHDVVADRDMRVEDPQGTEARRAQATALQPLVFDLDKESVALFREDTLALLHALNTTGLEDGGLETVRRDFNERHGGELLQFPVFQFRFRALGPEGVQNGEAEQKHKEQDDDGILLELFPEIHIVMPPLRIGNTGTGCLWRPPYRRS